MKRSFYARVALAGAGMLLGAFLWAGGWLQDRSVIVLEFGLLGDAVLGADVLIDGELVGQLRRMGSATRTGFEVEDGAHTVQVIHPDYGCTPIRIETRGSSSSVLVLLDVAEIYDSETGRVETQIVFNR